MVSSVKLGLPRQRAWFWALPALTVVWFAPDVAEALDQDFSALGLFLCFVIACVLRAAVGLWLFARLMRMHQQIAGQPARAREAFVLWFGFAALLLSVLALTRDHWAEALSDNAVIYFQTNEVVRATGDIKEAHAAWMHSWQSGWVLATELLLMAVIALIQTLFAYRLGHSKRSALLASACTTLCLVGYITLCPWILFDYDYFHGDLLVSALALDRLLPIATSPYTSIAIVWYWGFWLTSLRILRGAPT
jgi:hypothetical protein